MLSINQLPDHTPDEKIIMVVRRDLFILFKKVIMLMLLAVLPLAVFYVIFISYSDLLNNPTSYSIIVLSASAYYLFIWLFFYFSFVDYYLDVSIVTNHRIIDVKQNGFFSRTVSEQKLFRVQDVTSEIKGIIPTIFRYGNVYIQTAGEVERFNFQEVPNPNIIREKIIELAENDKKEMFQDVKIEEA